MKIKSILLIISCIYLIVYVSIIISLNDETFFNREFSKLNVYADFQNESLVNAKNQEIIGYIQGNVKNLDAQFFNQKERLHLQDVKNIFLDLRLIYFLAIFLGGIILGEMVWKSKINKNKLFKILIAIVSGEILLVAILAAIVFLNFEKAFILFHQLLFSNNNWLLDPVTDNLIRMYPQDFFVDMALQIMAKVGLIAGILLFIAILPKIADKIRNNKQ
jgi:integral membrane protein (TIGR01906 family)